MSQEYRTVKSSKHVIGTVSRKDVESAIRRLVSNGDGLHLPKEAKSNGSSALDHRPKK